MPLVDNFTDNIQVHFGDIFNISLVNVPGLKRLPLKYHGHVRVTLKFSQVTADQVSEFILGMLLAIPLTSFVKVIILESIRNYRIYKIASP